jgi:hypothetical protein
LLVENIEQATLDIVAKRMEKQQVADFIGS